MIEIRAATRSDLVSLPELEARSDTLFASLGIGPLPAAGLGRRAQRGAGRLGERQTRPWALPASTWSPAAPHLEQLSVDLDSHEDGDRASAPPWPPASGLRDAGYRELTLATYRDVPWNGPFYASEGFVESGPGRRLVRVRRLGPRRAGHEPVRRPGAHAPRPVISRVAEATDQVVVDQPGRLQVGVADGWTDEAKVTGAQVRAQCFRDRASRRGSGPCVATCSPWAHRRRTPTCRSRTIRTPFARPRRRGRCAPSPPPWPGCG